jgi:hypothetical protein
MSPKAPQVAEPVVELTKRLTKRAYVDLLRTCSAACRPHTAR